jgi:hypothetical protein
MASLDNRDAVSKMVVTVHFIDRSRNGRYITDWQPAEQKLYIPLNNMAECYNKQNTHAFSSS